MIDGTHGLDGYRNEPIVSGYCAVFDLFRSAAASAAWPGESGETLKYDTANVSTMVASQINAFPAFLGTKVRPSGFFAIASY